MNDATEKEVRRICHELADKIIDSARQHGEYKINTCVFMHPKSMTSITVNTIDEKRYSFRLQANIGNKYYDIYLGKFPVGYNSYNEKGDKRSFEERFKEMCKEIYSDHTEMIGMIYENHSL